MVGGAGFVGAVAGGSGDGVGGAGSAEETVHDAASRQVSELTGQRGVGRRARGPVLVNTGAGPGRLRSASEMRADRPR